MKKKPERNSSTAFDGASRVVVPVGDAFLESDFATIDPGDHTAIQLWDRGEAGALVTFHGMLTKFDMRAVNMCKGRTVIVEDVELWSGSVVSYTSAVRGDLFKLAFMIGGLISQVRRSAKSDVLIVSPKVWKGNLNYTRLRFILQERFNFHAKNDHEASAFGIGLWAKGVF